jgi:hypothetical protein
MPITREEGNPEVFQHASVMTSRGFETTIIIGFWEYCIIFSVTEFTILAFVEIKSSLLMPGFRGTPAVITTISLPAVVA